MKKEREHVKTKEVPSRQDSLTTKPKPIVVQKNDYEEDDRYYYMKPFELTLRRAVGAKKQGISCLVYHGQTMCFLITA